LADSRVVTHVLLLELITCRLLRHRGDLVVFEPTSVLVRQGFKDAFVKRIVGLPGDQVAITQGKVLINGQSLSEPYLPQNVETAMDMCLSELEFLTTPRKIPPNFYFVLGDNRPNSFDSRCWGLVPKSHLIGKITMIFWPLSRFGSLEIK
jgi:signal peptidase I